MKKFLLVVLPIALTLGCSKVEPPEEQWSEPVDGVRARLSIGFDADFSGSEMAVVYMEIQNVSDVAGPKDIYFDTVRSQFKWQLIDEKGTSLPQSPTAISIMSPPPYWIAVPYDSTLRFHVSVSGYGIKQYGGVALQLPGAFWQVSRKKEGAYYLSATFSSRENKEGVAKRAWSGTLSLPKVKLPEKKK